MKLAMRSRISIWIPFAFSSYLCYQAVICGLKNPVFSTPGFIPFFCFLPMVFFFVGASVQNNIRILEKRLDVIEEKMKLQG